MKEKRIILGILLLLIILGMYLFYKKSTNLSLMHDVIAIEETALDDKEVTFIIGKLITDKATLDDFIFEITQDEPEEFNEIIELLYSLKVDQSFKTHYTE